MMPNQRQIGNQGDGREEHGHSESSLPLYSLPAAAAAVALATCLHVTGVQAAPAQAQTVESESASATPVSAEQRQVASFVAKKYRLAVDEVQEFVAHAYHAASEFRLDPLLVLAIVSIESSFNPNARSPKGAQGLMQVLTRVHTDKFEPFGGPRAAFDPLANLKVGSQILKDYLVREGGSIERALKSYVGASMLPHDYGYGRKVLSERERLAKAAGVKTPPGKSLQAKAEPEEAAPSEKEAAKKEKRAEEKLAAKAAAAQPAPEVETARVVTKDERGSEAGVHTVGPAGTPGTSGTAIAVSPDAGKIIAVSQSAPAIAAAGVAAAGAAAITEAAAVAGASAVTEATAVTGAPAVASAEAATPAAPTVPASDVVHVSTAEVIHGNASDAAATNGSAADAAAATRGATGAGASDASVTGTSATSTGTSAFEAPAGPAAPAAAAPEALPALAAAPIAADLVPAFTAPDTAQETEVQPRVPGTPETPVQDSGSPANALLELGDFAEL